MLTGITLVEHWTHYSKYDHGTSEAEKTGFELGAVDVIVRSAIQDNAQSWISGEGGMQMVNKSATKNYEMVRFGLKGWTNFKDAKGNELKIEFVDRIVGGAPYKIVSDDSLKLIPGPVIAELADEIIEKNTASDTLRKK
jgi:hypothetical protein